MPEINYLSRPSFKLESGHEIRNFKLAYQTFGTLNIDRSNVVWVFHPFSSNTNPLQWWPGVFGEGELFDPQEYFIICANAIGSPYGTSAPMDKRFPLFTIRDVVAAQLQLAAELSISQITIAIGGSFGGSQALEFAYSFSGEIDTLILISCSAKETAWGIAIHETQRMAIEADGSFGEVKGGENGLKTARGIGLVSYRTSASYIQQQTDETAKIDDFKAASYIRYQGEKFEKRFNALSYYYLTKCLDSHNLARDRLGMEQALSKIQSSCLVIGIDTDALIPVDQQKYLAENLPKGQFAEVKSNFGHDGFLIEAEQISHTISKYLEKQFQNF